MGSGPAPEWRQGSAIDRLPRKFDVSVVVDLDEVSEEVVGLLGRDARHELVLECESLH
jgi:hypothetical protein